MSTRAVLAVGVIAAVVATAAGASAVAPPAAAPAVAAGRPGPPILYAPAATAPQLQNVGIWRAAPILVSGTAAYRDGEYLYQDYLYDDHGARLEPDPNDPRPGDNNQFSAPNGTYTYPTSMPDANSADLVELRVKPTADATAFRITLNTLHNPSRIGISVALGGRAGVVHPLPFGADTVAPADVFLTLHPLHGRLEGTITSALTGKAVAGPAVKVSVDLGRRQITALVPHQSWNPDNSVQRLAAAVGLWNAATATYLLPGTSATATQPGGAGLTPHPSAFFNAAFRFHEPTPTFGPALAGQVAGDTTWWREQAQGTALAAGDLSPLSADVDFGKLLRGVTDDSQVPTTGSLDRILASHFEPSQGASYGSSCYSGGYGCQYQGRLQPYAVYIPAKPAAPRGYGMTLLLHANAANYNEFLTSRNASQFGDRGTGSVVITPEARDPGSSYIGLAAADVFEVWADVARHYRLDPTWRAIAGYSLGGLGTFKLAEQFPDLFSRAVAIVGSPGTPVSAVPQSEELASLRNIPVMVWDVLPADELNPYSQLNVLALQKLGYRYDYLAFPGEHLTPAIDDNYTPAAAFLGSARVQPDPARITYVYGKDTLDGLVRATGDFPDRGLVADHAYWLSELRAVTGSSTCRGNTTPGCGTTAIVDATSGGFGSGDPVASGPQPGAGVLTGGALYPAVPYAEVKQTWASAPAAARTDSIILSASRLRSLTLDVHRARVDCRVQLHVSTDGPLDIALLGCGRTQHFG